VTRIGRVAKGLGALVLLGVLVGGVPWALRHFVGWPLPHHVPSASQVGRALNRQGIPAQTLIDALAVVVWLTWAALIASLAVEIPAALSGRHPPRLPIAGIFQPVTGHLVAAVIVACLAVASRPGHIGPVGSAGSGLAASVRPPVAALVVDDAVYTSAVGPTPPGPETSMTAPPRTATGPAPASTNLAELSVYVVQRGDTLWGIAQRELGDPLRWSEIYQLNEGRPQPDGTTLTDPHWIDPGWTLVLPTVATPASAPDSAPPPLSAPTTTEPPAAPPVTTPTTTAPSPHTTVPSTTNGVSRHHQGEASDMAPVRLPSGSVIAGSFAAGVLSAVALGRLRRRHAYRYRPPQPGRNLTRPTLRPSLDHLVRVAPVVHDSDGGGVDQLPSFPFDDDQRRLDPGQVEMGIQDGASVTIEVTKLSGVALSGTRTDDVARALIASLLTRAVPGATEVLCSDALAERLLPGLAPDRSLRRAETMDQMARSVEAERIARTRRLASVEAPDASTFRHENPENPLPLLLVLIDAVSSGSEGRWEALLADAPRLGIAVLFLTDSALATGQIVLGADATVTVESGGSVPVTCGTKLYRLRADEAVELLGAVNEANRQDEDEPDADDNDTPDSDIEIPTPAVAGRPLEDRPETSWPQPVPSLDTTEHPLVVNLLGPYRIAFLGEPVTAGLRARARLLLAWCLLRPEGATIDEIVDALWPDTPPERVLKQFWHPLGDLRSFCRGPNDTNLEVLQKAGEHYRPNPDEISCDLWDFEAGLSEATAASDDDRARTSLRRAVAAYDGDLMAGADHPWLEPAREDLHRRAVDAHLRLAELEEQAGEADGAIEILDRVIAFDRYAEEPYRRMMTLYAEAGRHDAVRSTWRLLQRSLAEIDVDVDDATTRLYRDLTTRVPETPRPIRLSS
jgi:DNA-binding SARP family transcriptional activator